MKRKNESESVSSFSSQLQFVVITTTINGITNTKSGTELNRKEYEKWADKRYSLNRFFQKAGYRNLNVSQKTFPIPSEKLYEPQGRYLQIRGKQDQPIRNKISTQQAAQLMYEIVTGKTISPEISQNMQQWLVWDLTSQKWRNIDPNTGHFNPIRTFFGESLPTHVYFAYAKNWQIFPQISRQVFESMNRH